MRVIGIMIKQMAKGNSFILMESIMLGNLRMIELTVKEHSIIEMELS